MLNHLTQYRWPWQVDRSPAESRASSQQTLGGLFESVTDLDRGADVLARRPYGVIEVVDGVLREIRLRPWPKLVSWPDLYFIGDYLHRNRRGNRCLLFYNQPRRFPKFLALKYLLAFRGTKLATVQESLRILDAIARLKRSDAILCDVANLRLSEWLMRRYGFEPHAPARWHRNFIKRFYGTYPV